MKSIPNSRHAALILLVGFQLIVYISLTSPVKAGNDGSRWDSVFSLVAGQDYVIDNAPYPTVDKVMRNGHLYSSKPPLLINLVAEPVLLFEYCGLSIPAHSWLITRVVLIMFNIFPFCCFLFLYSDMLQRGRYSSFTQYSCMLVAAWGTLLTSYSTVLNNHILAAFGVFAAIYTVIAIESNAKDEACSYLLVGLAAAWAGSC